MAQLDTLLRSHGSTLVSAVRDEPVLPHLEEILLH
jgi:hypothetical protein